MTAANTCFMDEQEPFVGRATQLGALVSAVAAAGCGEGGVALIGGEAGVGKTRLVTEVAARVACPVLWARCWQGEGAPAFWPWHQLVRVGAPGGAGPVGGETTALPAQPEELDRLLREASISDGTDPTRFRLFDAVVERFAVAAARRPLLLVLEDLHWADEPSLRLLQFMARDPRSRRLAVIGTYRDTDLNADSALMRCIADLVDTGLHLALGGLARRDVGVLAESLTPDTAISRTAVSLLHRRSGGNPLFVREIMRFLRDGGAVDALSGSAPPPVPASVRAVVAQRLARLAPRTREVLGAGSVVGGAFDAETLTFLVDGRGDEVLTALQESVSRGLVRRTDDGVGFDFVHAVVQEVLYDGLAYADRASLHRGMAAWLAAARTRHLSQMAHHLLQGAVTADDRRRAVDHAIRAGRHDLELLAYEEAAGWFARALDAHARWGTEDAQRIDLFLLLGEAALAAGDGARARDAYRQAGTLARRDRDPERLAAAALGLGAGLGGFEVRLLDVVQVELLEQALDALGQEPSRLRAWVLARLAVALSFMDSAVRRRQISEEAVATARRVGDRRALGYALAGHCDVIAGPDFCATRRSEAEEVIGLGVQAADPQLELLGRRLRLVTLLELGEVGEADHEIERFARVADRLRQPLYRWYVPLWKAMRSLMRRELSAAARLRAEAEELGTRAHSGNAVVLTFTQWWVQQRYEGHFVEAGTAMAELLGEELASAPPVTAGPRVVTATQIGEHEKARVLLHQWRGAPPRETSGDSEWLPESAQLAEAAVLVGAHDEARELSRQLRPYAHLYCVEGIGAAFTGSVAWYLAMLARFLGDDAGARAYEAQARAAHRRAGLVGDPPPLAVREDRPTASVPVLPTSASLVHEGATWAVSYAGRTARLRDGKGMRDLAVLLSRPERDVHCLDLMRGLDVGGEPGPALDGQARRAYERRIRDLQEEIDDATAANDPHRAERAEAELDMLVQQLAEAFGLSGRGRATGSAAERARSAVGWRIRAALRQAAELHPELGQHLRNAVRTGTWCSYRPETAVRWDVRVE